MSVVLGVRVAPLVGFDFDNFTTDNINSDRIAGRLADGANEDARFVGPCGIVSLAQGLVVCDERDGGRACIRLFNWNDGSVTTVAGDTTTMRTRRRGGPGGSDEGRGKSVRIPSFGSNQCTACSEKVVAFSSQGEVIHLIDIASGEVTALAGGNKGSKQQAGSVDGFGSSTRFNEVVALELLRDGRLAILDRVNDDRSVVRIMDLKSKTTVHLAHVEKVEGYGDSLSMRQLHDGRLLVAARSGLYSVNVETGLVSSLSTRAYRSMAELPDGRVAFTNAVGIHLLDPATLAVATLAKTANVRGLAAVLKSLDGIAITPNGEIAVTDRDRKCIWRITLPSPQDEFVAALKSLDGPLALRLLDRAGARVDDRVRTMLLRETINGRSPLWECLAAKANCSRLVERIASTETSIDEFMSRSHTAELLSAAMKERQLAVASRIIARGIQIDESTKSTIVEQLSDLQSWRNAVLDESCAALVDLVVELEPIKFSFDSDVLVAALGKDSFFSAMRLLDRGVSVDAHAKQALLAKNAQLLKKLVLSRSDDSWSALGDRILKAAPDLVPCAIQSALEGFDPKVAAHLMEHFDAIPDSFMLLKRQDDGSSMIVKLFLRDGYRALAVQLAERSKALAEEVYSPETLIVAIEAGNDAAVAHLLDKGVLFDESRLSSDCLEQMANESDTAELVDRLLATGRANGLKKTFASPAERLTRALDSRNPDLADRLLGSGAVLDPAWCVHFFEVDSEKFIQLVLHPSPVVPRLVHQIMELYKSKRAVVAEDHGSSWTAKLYAERWARCFIAALRTHDSVAASWIIDELPSVLSDKRVKAALGQNHLWQELVVLERCSGLVDRFLRSNPDLFADALVAACSVQNLALASRLLSPGYLGVHTASNPHTEAQVERIPKGLTKGAEHASVLRKLFCKPSYLPLVRRLVDEFPLLKKGVFSSASLVSLIEAENAPAAQWLIESEVTLDTKTLLSHGGWRKVFSSPLQDCIVITDHLMRQHPELKEATTTREMLLAALRARDTFAANRLLDMGVLVDGGLVDVLTAADGGWYDVVADASDACVALTDRLMVLSPALREAAVSTKTLLAALESRSMFAANRLLDLGTMFDDELLSAFAASDDGDGPWRALILDTSAACTALVDRLVVLSSVLKDAAVSPKSLFAALDACNAVAANRLLELGALLDDELVAKFAADGKWRTIVLNSERACIDLSNRLMHSSSVLREAAVSSSVLVAALSACDSIIANRLLDMGALLDESSCAKFVKDKKGWRLLLLSHDLACAKLSLRLMEAFPMLREAALASGELFLEAIKTRNMVAANRLLDAGLRIDDDILSRLGATDEKEILAPWSSIVLDMLPTCTVMVDRVISLHPALGSDAVVVACENARWDVALRLLGDKTLKLDEQHLSSLLTKTVDLAARMPFDDLLKWQGVQVYESHHPWRVSDTLNKHIELKGASSLYVAFDKRSDLSLASFTLNKTDTSDDSRWFEFERASIRNNFPGVNGTPFLQIPVNSFILNFSGFYNDSSDFGYKFVVIPDTLMRQVSVWSAILLSKNMSIELAERLMRLIPELKPMALSGDPFSNAIAIGRAETASWLMDLGAEVDVAMQATLLSRGWRNLLFDPSDACTALANRMMASSPKLKADAESSDALFSALEIRNALAANRCMELGGAIDAEVGAKLLLTENGSARVGDQVEVRSGGKEMPSEAKVTAVNKGDGTYHVKYDDNGREDDVKSSLVRSISTWRKLFFDPRDEWVVLTDRLMESNAELKRATLSSKMLLAALETRALIAANRLMDMNVLLDDDACSKFVEPFKNEGMIVGARVQVRADGKSSFSPGKIVYHFRDGVFGIEYDDGTNEMSVYSDRIRSLESGGGSWRKLLFDPSDECGALANRLARSIPRLKEAAISEETLTAALRFSNAIASNRLFDMMDRKLDDTTGATFLAAGGLGTTQSDYLTWLREEIEVGSRVKAKRSVQDSNSGEFYPGRVSRLRGEGSFDIDFDDGEFESKVSSGSVRKVAPAAANQICGSAFRSLVLGQSHECVALVDRLLAQDSALRQPALIVSVLDGNASASHRFLNLGAEVDASVFETFLHGQGWNKAVASESCASLVERLVERDAKLGQHAVLIALRAGQYHLALTLLRDLRVPVKGEVLTYLMCKRGSTTLWHEIVQDEDSFAKAVIAELANQSEELLNVRDGNNRLAYNMGTEQAREAMRVAFFCGRYKMSIALHTSATCRVLLATDMQHLEEPSVVIKLMLNRDQFEREVAAREQGLDREFVVPILQTSDDDEIKDLWLQAVTELNYPEYRYGIIMEYADRNLDAIMRQERPKPADARTAIKGLVDALAHLASSKVLHSDVKLLNIVRIHELSTGLKTIKLIDMDAIAKLDRSGFMGAKFSSGVLPPEMFEVLDGDGVETFSAYWDHEISQQTELWRKIEPRWSRSGDAIVVKTWREVPLASKEVVDHNKLPYKRVPADISHDIWSLGTVTYQLLCGAPLFQVNRDDDLASAEDYLQVARWNLTMLRRKLDSFLSTQSMQSVTVEERWKTVDLLSWLLQPRPEDRPASFDAILKHAFFDDGGAWRMSDLHKQIACDNDDVKTVLPKFTADVLNSSEHPLGSTPLHIAVIENKLHFAKQLIAQEADANKSDSTGRTPIQHLLALLQKPRSDDDRAKQLQILPMLSKATKYQSEMITETGGQGHAHASRARHLVSACDSLRDSEWGAPLAQLLLQQAAEHSWLDACEKLVEKGAKLDEPSPWDPRLPRQIGMASNLPELRKFFQTYNTFLDRYILGDHIHSSPSCVVVEAEDVNNRSKVVVKLMAEKDNYEREMHHVGLRDGKYIVEVLYSSTEHDAAKNADQLYWNEAASKFGYESMGWGLVMPRAQRNLMFIMKTERLDADNGADDPNGDANGVRLCFQELAQSLQFMHGNGVIHGDVKPLNYVRLSSAGGYRLIDLDCVNKIGEPVGAKIHNSSAYAPPEMLFRDGSAILLKDASNNGNPRYQDLPASTAYDIWSFGVMLYEALGWKTLFEADNSDNLSDAREMDKLQKWNLSQLDCAVTELRITLRDPSHTCHRETALRACDLIAWLLQPAPADRPKSFDDVLAHSFFAGRAGTWRMSNVHVRLAIDRTIDGLEDRHVQESCRKGEHPLGKSLLHIAALEMEPKLVRLLIDKLPIMFVTQANPATTTVPPTSFVNSRGLSFGASHPSHRSQQIGAGEGQLDLLDDSGNSPLHALLNLHINDWDASECVEVCKLLADVTDLDLKNSVGKTVIEIGCNSECSAINSHFNARRNQRYAQRREDLFRRVVASDDDEIIEPWGLGANSYHDSEKELVPSFHEWLSKLTREQTAQEEADEAAQLAVLQLETCANEAKKTSFQKRAETARFRRKLLKRAVSLFKGCTGLHFLATYVRISSDKLPATFVQFKEEGPLAKPSSFEERKVPGYTWKKVMSDIVRFLGGTANVAYYKALLESCDRRTLLTDYRFEEVLGAGGFGQVSLCSNRHSARQSAIKIVMPNGGENSDAFRAAQSETELQQRGSTCEYITKIFAWGVAGSTLLWVSMEHCDLGELRKYIAKDKGLVCPKTGVVNLRLRNRWMEQLILALDHLRNQRIMHRDLKPENVLISSKAGGTDTAVVKLTDFGLAIDVPVDVPQNYGYAGTEGYIAPELEDRQPYFFEVDTWSMALVLYEMITGGSINHQSISSLRNSYKANVSVRKNKRKGAAPESCFDCSSYAQDKASADLLKFMLVSLPRNRPTPTLILSTMGTLGLCDVGPSSDAPLPCEISSGKEEGQLAQARLENEALKRDLAESRAREVDANTRGDSKLAQARAEIEALKQNLVGARTTEVDANARGDREGLISPVRAHRELAELRNAHTRAAAQQIHTPLETRSEGSPDLFVPPSEREGFLPTRLREASQYETEAAWRETRAALQRETEAAWRETQTALRDKEVKEAEARIEREAARKEIAAVRMERDKEVAAVRMERDKEVAASRAERDAALTRNFEEVSVLRAERDAALKDAAGKETALAVAQAVRDTESRMTAELTRQDQHLMAQWHLGPTQYEHNGAGLPSVTSRAEMGSRNTGRDRFGDATTDADLRGSASSLVGPPRDDSDAARARIAPPPVSQQRPSRPASANNADTRLRGSPYQQQQQRPQQHVQNQNRRRG